MKPKDFINKAIENQLHTVSYRLPGASQSQTIVSKSITQSTTWDPISDSFIVQPFDGIPYLFHPDLKFQDFDITEQAISAFGNTKQYNYPTKSEPAIPKAEYLKLCEYFVNAVQGGSFDKLVLSRIQSQKLRSTIVSIYASLLERYPGAFVYFLHSPILGTWLGATPEQFLKVKNQEVETVALAGTQPVNNQNWSSKEREEQAYVTSFISDILKKHHCPNIELNGPKIINAGPVAHIATHLKSDIPKDIPALIRDLHPTPAVCGIPQHEAQQFILKNEPHQRELYSGFLGPCGQEINLFVNLRCLQIVDNVAQIYVGGGITKDSDPESEWEETNIKAETLISVFEKN